jgi:hypothetical protein
MSKIQQRRVDDRVVMKYTKHRVHRIADLNDKFFEVVFEKNGLRFTPGAAVKLYHGPDIPIFIASGVQEPWIRLIVNRDLFPDFDHEAISIRLHLGVEYPISLFKLKEPSNFILTADGIGAFFSYVST